MIKVLNWSVFTSSSFFCVCMCTGKQTSNEEEEVSREFEENERLGGSRDSRKRVNE